MTTIKVNERTKAGKLLLEMAQLFSKDKKGVEIIKTKTKAKPKEKDYPISKNVPNAETLKVFRDTDKGIGLTSTKSHKDLLEKLYS